MNVEEKTLTINEKSKRVKVVAKKITKEEARIEFPYRPYSKYAESQWGGNYLCDDERMIRNNVSELCSMCHAPTRLSCITEGICLDCTGEAEFLDYDPRETTIIL